MATRAAKAQPADWRAAFRRSLARALQMTGSGAALCLHRVPAAGAGLLQPDRPSFSTAAAGPVANWMGRAGAWAADMALPRFGVVALLLLPLTLRLRAQAVARCRATKRPRTAAAGGARSLMLLRRHGAARHGARAGDRSAEVGACRPATAGLAGLLGARRDRGGRRARARSGQGLGDLRRGPCLPRRRAVARRPRLRVRLGTLLTLPRALRRMPSLPRSENPFKPQKKERLARRTTARPVDRGREPQTARNHRPATRGQARADRQARPSRRTCSPITSCRASTCSTDPPPDKGSRSSTSWRWNATPACSKPCSTISTSRARSPRCAPARW